MYVVDSAVAIPCFVSVTYPAVRLSIFTFIDDAVGIILPIDDASSSTVVLPRFCVRTNLLEIAAASSSDNLYALIAVVSTSTAVDVSVNPAFARFPAVSTNPTALSTDTPADNAWYPASASPSADNPVLLDSSSI